MVVTIILFAASVAIMCNMAGVIHELRAKLRRRETELLKEELRAYNLQQTVNRTADNWNALVARINRLGGERFLQTGEASQAPAEPKTRTVKQFSEDEIAQLIKLCHPDKHANSSAATAITQKLLELRKPKRKRK